MGSIQKIQRLNTGCVAISAIAALVSCGLLLLSYRSRKVPWKCTMESCFKFTNCMGSFSFFVTDEIAMKLGVAYTQAVSRPWFTSQKESACLVAETYLTSSKPILRLGSQNNPWNVILLDQRDKLKVNWKVVGSAILAKTHASPPYFRPGYDISMPLPPRAQKENYGVPAPGPRKYFITFKGTVYVRGTIGWFRESLNKLHNPQEKIVVVTTCKHQTNQRRIRFDPSLAEHCKSNMSAYEEYSYTDLMNTTFSLVPGGGQPASYRFLESLQAGAIPVLIRSIHHPYVLPFEQIICWPRCIVSVLINSYTGDHHTDFVPNEEWVTNLLQSLRGIRGKELQIRQHNCAKIYHKHFDPAVRVLDSVVESIKSNMNGWVDPCAHGGKY